MSKKGVLDIVTQFSERNSVNMRDPKYWIFFTMVNGEPAIARLAEISLGTSLASFLNGLLTAALRTPGIAFFEPYSPFLR